MTKRTHLTFEIGEHEDDGYHVCDTCGGRTMLICAGPTWSVDSEPYKAGEDAPDDDEHSADGYVDIEAEVTGHYCPECHKMTSLSFNQ